jgi:hypothetical protein
LRFSAITSSLSGKRFPYFFDSVSRTPLNVNQPRSRKKATINTRCDTSAQACEITSSAQR